MYCPSCGTEASDQTKYCTKCGVNLRRVRGVLGKGGATVRKGDDREPEWLKDQRAKKEARREARRMKTPEEKRLEEIKAGVISSSVGFGLMVFLSFLFDAIASTVDGPASNILRTLWVVGLIPFMIGLGVLFNGLFVSKRIVEVKRQQEQKDQQLPLFSAPNTSPVARLVEPSQSPISDFSITETTTTKLREPVSVPSPRDTN
jgi:zinc-ribbon domain